MQRIARCSGLYRIFLTVLCLLFAAALPLSRSLAAAPESFHEVGEYIVNVSTELEAHTCTAEQHLKVSEDRIFRLFFNDQAPSGFSTGDIVEVRGELVDDQQFGKGVVVEAISLVIKAADSLDLGATVGERKALVLRVNFNDGSVGCSKEQVADIMWSGSRSVDGLFQASSWGMLSFPGDTDDNGSVDVFDVSINHSVLEADCPYYTWAYAADSAATSQGIDLGLYQHRTYVLPNTVSSCGWAGLGNFSCFGTCRIWIKTCQYPDVYAHELGHNLNMHHSSTDTDNDGVLDCEYCDKSGIMGYGGVGWRHFNSVHKSQMGWIPAERELDVTVNGVYDIAALEIDPATAEPAPPSGIQILKIPVPDQLTDNYYISYRLNADDYSVNLRSDYNLKTNIHRRNGTSSRSLYLTALADGETWDDGKGVQITQLSTGDNSVTVEVDIGVAPTPTPTAEPTPTPPQPTPTPTVAPTTAPTPGPTAGPNPTGDPTSEPTATPTPDNRRYTVKGMVRLRGRSKLPDKYLSMLRIVLKNAATKEKALIPLGLGGTFSVSLGAGSYKIRVKGKVRRKNGTVLRSRWKKIAAPGFGDKQLVLRLR